MTKKQQVEVASIEHPYGPLLPAGKYWIGDPGYVLTDWDAYLDDSDFEGGVYELNGALAMIFDTDHGDGGYEDQEGRVYGVDSGMIGAVPVSMVEDSKMRRSRFGFPEPKHPEPGHLLNSRSRSSASTQAAF
jgi:hypothetical protein